MAEDTDTSQFLIFKSFSLSVSVFKMTSTSFNVGIGDGSRLSSRVLRPPGGGHTDIFGGEPEPPRGRRQAPSAAANLIQG